jgi:hypothetical protein
VSAQPVSVVVDGPWLEYPSDEDPYSFLAAAARMRAGGAGREVVGDEGISSSSSSLTSRFLDSSRHEDHLSRVCRPLGRKQQQ